jgi:biotin transport system substrate-specific component
MRAKKNIDMSDNLMIISSNFIKTGDNMHNISESILKEEIISNKTVVSAIGIATFTLLTWISAHVYIPLGFTPVPITLQTLFVFLSGAILGRKSGAISQSAYLIMGIIGMPMFTGGGYGALHILGPTGGYILGFIMASWLIGYMLDKNNALYSIITAFLAGWSVIFAFGAGWLVFGLGFSVKQAFLLGVLPFVPGSIIKITIATIITKNYLKRARQIFS